MGFGAIHGPRDVHALEARTNVMFVGCVLAAIVYIAGFVFGVSISPNEAVSLAPMPSMQLLCENGTVPAGRNPLSSTETAYMLIFYTTFVGTAAGAAMYCFVLRSGGGDEADAAELVNAGAALLGDSMHGRDNRALAEVRALIASARLKAALTRSSFRISFRLAAASLVVSTLGLVNAAVQVLSNPWYPMLATYIMQALAARCLAAHLVQPTRARADLHGLYVPGVTSRIWWLFPLIINDPKLIRSLRAVGMLVNTGVYCAAVWPAIRRTMRSSHTIYASPPTDKLWSADGALIHLQHQAQSRAVRIVDVACIVSALVSQTIRITNGVLLILAERGLLVQDTQTVLHAMTVFVTDGVVIPVLVLAAVVGAQNAQYATMLHAAHARSVQAQAAQQRVVFSSLSQRLRLPLNKLAASCELVHSDLVTAEERADKNASPPAPPVRASRPSEAGPPPRAPATVPMSSASLTACAQQARYAQALALECRDFLESTEYQDALQRGRLSEDQRAFEPLSLFLNSLAAVRARADIAQVAISSSSTVQSAAVTWAVGPDVVLEHVIGVVLQRAVLCTQAGGQVSASMCVVYAAEGVSSQEAAEKVSLKQLGMRRDAGPSPPANRPSTAGDITPGTQAKAESVSELSVPIGARTPQSVHQRGRTSQVHNLNDLVCVRPATVRTTKPRVSTGSHILCQLTVRSTEAECPTSSLEWSTCSSSAASEQHRHEQSPAQQALLAFGCDAELITCVQLINAIGGKVGVWSTTGGHGSSTIVPEMWLEVRLTTPQAWDDAPVQVRPSLSAALHGSSRPVFDSAIAHFAQSAAVRLLNTLSIVVASRDVELTVLLSDSFVRAGMQDVHLVSQPQELAAVLTKSNSTPTDVVSEVHDTAQVRGAQPSVFTQLQSISSAHTHEQPQVRPVAAARMTRRHLVIIDADSPGLLDVAVACAASHNDEQGTSAAFIVGLASNRALHSRCCAAGCAEVLYKPVRFCELLSACTASVRS